MRLQEAEGAWEAGRQHWLEAISQDPLSPPPLLMDQYLYRVSGFFGFLLYPRFSRTSPQKNAHLLSHPFNVDHLYEDGTDQAATLLGKLKGLSTD